MPTALTSTPACHHGVHFASPSQDRAQETALFLAPALLRGEAVGVVASLAHQEAIGRALVASGVDIEAARQHGNYLTWDAAQTLRTYTTPEGFDAVSFQSDLSDLLQDLAGRFGAVSLYGEMVSLLAEAGLLTQALELEALWDVTMARMPLRILCGYASLAPEEEAQVVAAHAHVAAPVEHWNILDLGSSPQAARTARHWVTQQCQLWDAAPSRQDEIAVVVSELVGNALRHTDSEVTLIAATNAEHLTVSVVDGSVSLPQGSHLDLDAESGRGVLLLTELSSRWGLEPLSRGKRIWASFVH